ncbi:hypothetical protein AB4254_08000 [Vibrio breoganii]
MKHIEIKHLLLFASSSKADEVRFLKECRLYLRQLARQLELTNIDIRFNVGSVGIGNVHLVTDTLNVSILEGKKVRYRAKRGTALERRNNYAKIDVLYSGRLSELLCAWVLKVEKCA